MQQSFEAGILAHSRENEILAEHESLLDAGLASGRLEADEQTRRSTRRRVVPFVVLVLVGVAVAFMPLAFKDALTTGRSVAHGSSR